MCPKPYSFLLIGVTFPILQSQSSYHESALKKEEIGEVHQIHAIA